jgi:hypothetical protein
MSESDSNDLRDPSFAAGRVMALEAELEGERTSRRTELELERAERRRLAEAIRTERQEREDHDTLVSAALADVRDAVHELQGEVVRQGGVAARTFRIAEATAQHLGVNPDALEPVPDVPVLSRMLEAEESIAELRRRRARQGTRPDPLELEPPPPSTETPQGAPEKPRGRITRTFHPKSPADWTQLVVAAVLALGALAAAVQQIAASLAGH